jgi:Domain of unknown function (DUF4169)
MGDIVNLRHVRKARARAEKAEVAAENRARFGRTKAEKSRDKAETEVVARTLDGAKRTPPPPDGKSEPSIDKP